MAKIPDHATCVFKGVIYDVYQWQQDMFDGTKATFEALKRPNTVQVIALQGDRVFFARQEQPNKPPFISLFGGRAEEGETPLATAKRELLEEAGLSSETWREVRRYSAPGKIDWTVYFFVAENCRKTADLHLDGGEKISGNSASLDEFVTEIITAENFADYELRQEILSAFNQPAAAKLKDDILGAK